MYRAYLNQQNPVFAVAPMMDWTDRHCRYFHRQLSDRALLYTEMVVADALIHGDPERHLDFDAVEHPVALQLGGSDAEKLAQAVRIAGAWGYDEINLNVGCPSDRVQSGTFGACLMREPDRVARCVEAMKAETTTPITVKCRLGVDDQDVETALDDLATRVFEVGCDALWVHARKAWLQGLSPKENRDVPPLDYDRVRRLKARWPDRFIGINGGIGGIEAALEFTRASDDLPALDGVMLGRAAYQEPMLLAQVDSAFYGQPDAQPDLEVLCETMMEYISNHISRGGRAHHVTRHMIGLFHGMSGAKRFRQILSVEATARDADHTLLKRAFDAVLLPQTERVVA